MSEKKTPIEKLPELLVHPERFGRVAIAPIVKLPLPELARVYDWPE